MTILQVDSPFFISETEALALIDAKMDDIKSKIDASSGQNANQSLADATNWNDGGNNPCDGGVYEDTSSCNCCICA